jgi:hypothetical protein
VENEKLIVAAGQLFPHPLHDRSPKTLDSNRARRALFKSLFLFVKDSKVTEKKKH